MVGVSGGEYGIRGYVAALDAETGEEVWRTYTIPGPGEPGHDTWPGDTWQNGWRFGLDHRAPTTRQAEPRLLGHRQCGAVDGRLAPRRQPVHDFGHRARRRDRQAPRLSPVPLERFLGLGRGLGAAADRCGQGRCARCTGLVHAGAQRLPVAARALAPRDRSASSTPSRTSAGRVHRASIPKTGRPEYDPDADVRAPDKYGRRSARRSGAARTGRRTAYNPKTGYALHPGEREPVRQPGGRGGRVRAWRALPRLRDRRHRPAYRGRCGPHRRVQAWNLDHRREGLDLRIPGDVAELGAGADHGRRSGVRRRRQRPRSSGRSTPTAARCSGSIRRTPASPACRPPIRSTACSTSRCSRAGASMPSACRARSSHISAGAPTCRRAASCGSSP